MWSVVRVSTRSSLHGSTCVSSQCRQLASGKLASRRVHSISSTRFRFQHPRTTRCASYPSFHTNYFHLARWSYSPFHLLRDFQAGHLVPRRSTDLVPFDRVPHLYETGTNPPRCLGIGRLIRLSKYQMRTPCITFPCGTHGLSEYCRHRLASVTASLRSLTFKRHTNFHQTDNKPSASTSNPSPSLTFILTRLVPGETSTTRCLLDRLLFRNQFRAGHKPFPTSCFAISAFPSIPLTMDLDLVSDLHPIKDSPIAGLLRLERRAQSHVG